MKRISILLALFAGVALGIGVAQVEMPEAAAQVTITKSALRDSVQAQGFQVEPVSGWDLVGEVNNVRKYDVAFEYEGTFGIAQVKVTDDGLPTENAEVLSRLEVPAPTTTFAERLSTFLRAQEGGAVYAISRVEANEVDKVAIVYAYIDGGATLTRKTYVVRERNNVMSFKELL